MFFLSRISSGLTSSHQRAAGADDSDILCLLIWKEMFHFSVMLSSLCYTWGNWDTEKVSNLSRVTVAKSGGLGLEPGLSVFQVHTQRCRHSLSEWLRKSPLLCSPWNSRMGLLSCHCPLPQVGHYTSELSAHTEAWLKGWQLAGPWLRPQRWLTYYPLPSTLDRT